MNQPTVTVLMPVYNGEKYLREAIDSILSQTYQDFEFIIINDGCTDSSDAIIRAYRDPRIRYIKKEVNQGFSSILNEGLSLAKGTYIARMDCDDLSAPTRLEKQAVFLDSHADYGVVGTLFGIINQHRQIHDIGGVKLLEDEDLKLGLLFGNIFCHGETMMRSRIIKEHHLFYDQTYTPCEDYDFWVKMSKYTKFKTLQEVLYFYMVHEDSMSGRQSDRMSKKVEAISNKVQAVSRLPLITPRRFIAMWQNGQTYKDQFFVIGGRPVMAYLQLAYQVFLFRLGKKYINRYRIDGVLLVIASFLINPRNWYRHLFKLFPA